MGNEDRPFIFRRYPVPEYVSQNSVILSSGPALCVLYALLKAAPACTSGVLLTNVDKTAIVRRPETG